ncbi:MAG: proline dehydrogenase family protein [Candidatus Zixiibacteriota bacterium]
MLKAILLYLSRQKAIQSFMTKFGVTRRVVDRFVSGEELEDGLNAVKKLNSEGAIATLDHLGEEVSEAGEAIAATEVYLDALDRINERGVDTNVSAKPTQLGLKVDKGLCEENFTKMIERAAKYNNFVRMDMEGSDCTEDTLEVFYRLRKKYDNVGIVIQSLLHRSEEDVDEILKLDGRIRLCKGAYKEPKEIAFPKRPEVDENFVKLMEKMLKSGIYHGMATHDERLIEKTKQFAQKNNIPKDNFEFQLLYGIRTELARQLIRDGYKVRIYIPFGQQWYPYFMRRLAERPANLFFFIKNFFRA